MKENSGNQKNGYLQSRMALMKELGKGIPKVMSANARLHDAVVADGALSYKTKELMALAIGISVRCDGCIAYHVNAALQAGATYEEIVETIGVAIMMGGGPSVMYGTEALEAYQELQPVHAGRSANGQ